MASGQGLVIFTIEKPWCLYISNPLAYWIEFVEFSILVLETPSFCLHPIKERNNENSMIRKEIDFMKTLLKDVQRYVYSYLKINFIFLFEC